MDSANSEVFLPQRKLWTLSGPVLSGPASQWRSSPEMSPQNSINSFSGYFPSPSPSSLEDLPEFPKATPFCLNDYPLVADWEQALSEQHQSGSVSPLQESWQNDPPSLRKPLALERDTPRIKAPDLRGTPGSTTPSNSHVPSHYSKHSEKKTQGLARSPNRSTASSRNPSKSQGHQEFQETANSLNPSKSSMHYTALHSHERRLSDSSPARESCLDQYEGLLAEYLELETPIDSEPPLKPISISDLVDESQIAEMNLQARVVRACRTPGRPTRAQKSVPLEKKRSCGPGLNRIVPSPQVTAESSANQRSLRHSDQIRAREDHLSREERHERELHSETSDREWAAVSDKVVSYIPKSSSTSGSVVLQRDMSLESTVEQLNITHQSLSGSDSDFNQDGGYVGTRMHRKYNPATKRSIKCPQTKSKAGREINSDFTSRAQGINSNEGSSSITESHREEPIYPRTEASRGEDMEFACGPDSMRKETIREKVVMNEMLRQNAENEAIAHIVQERKEFFKKIKQIERKHHKKQSRLLEQNSRGSRGFQNHHHEGQQDHEQHDPKHQGQNHREFQEFMEYPKHSQYHEHHQHHQHPQYHEHHQHHQHLQHHEQNENHEQNEQNEHFEIPPVQENLQPVLPSVCNENECHQNTHHPQRQVSSEQEIILAQQNALRYVRAAERDRQRVLNYPRGEPPKDEYSVIDEGIPPYQAQLHRYLDLMAYDERFSPVLRVNRYLVHGDGELAEAIAKFSRFNLLPTDLWSVSHIDERDYERLIPELIPSDTPDFQ